MFKKILIPFVAAFFCLYAGISEKVQEVMEELEPLIERSLEEYRVPGLALGLVVEGELVYARGFGKRDKANNLPVTTKTLFPIGSCTKSFTSFLVGTYVDEGELGWDTPVSYTMPELKLWDWETTYHLSFRDALTHRSGLPRHDFLWYNGKMSRSELLKKLEYLEPACPLRQRYLYNNLLYLLAGAALEKISGKSWEELITEKILKPLSMKQTNFAKQIFESGDYAIPYIEKEGQLQSMIFRDLSVIGPAGSMNSSVEDLSRWIKMHLAGGVYNERPLLQSSTLQEMLLPQVIATGTPEAPGVSFSAYGIGWNVISYRGRTFLSHDGISDGFTSVVGFFPEEKVGVIVLANKNMTAFPRFISMQVLDKILGLPFVDWIGEGLEGIRKTKETGQQKQDPTRKVGTVPSHPLSDFTGRFEHAAYGTLTIDLQQDQLCLSYNDISYPLTHWHYDLFAVAEAKEPVIVSLAGTKVQFAMNPQGEIAQVAIAFEPLVREIVFHRKRENGLAELSYLRKFTGLYEIYGYTVDIVIRGGTLCAIIPGQPVYELMAMGENEFSVKSKTGYTLRFVLDSQEKVREILLMQPYGTFSAKPKEENS